MFKNSFFSLFFSSSVAALLIAMLSSCDNENNQHVQDLEIHTVKLIKIADTRGTKVNRFPVVIDMEKVVDLSMSVAGVLSEFPVQVGQRVERGDIVAVLDQKDFNDALTSAQAEFNHADEQYRNVAELVKDEIFSAEALEQRKLQRDIANLQLNNAQKALENATMYAPYNGVITEVLIAPLQNVKVGQTLVKLMSNEVLKAKLNLPTAFITPLSSSTGQGVKEIKAFVILDAVPNQAIDAVYDDVSLPIEISSQNHPAAFTFELPGNLSVLPGAKATLELSFRDESEALYITVPLGAISSDGMKTFVWVVNPETMIVSKRIVSIEQGSNNMLTVTEGLSVDEIIVGSNASYLFDGMQVREERLQSIR